MEKRVHLFVSRKNVLTWLMALCLVGSAVARIVITGVKGIGYSQEVWSQIVLPVAAALLYVLITLINGKEGFYKTAIPFWMMGLYFVIRPHAFLSGPFILGMFYLCILFFCAMYTLIVSGKLHPWFLSVLFAIPLVGMGYLCSQTLDQIMETVLLFLPDILFFAGGLLLTAAIRVHTDG